MEKSKKPRAYMSLPRADIQNSRTNTYTGTRSSDWQALRMPLQGARGDPLH